MDAHSATRKMESMIRQALARTGKEKIVLGNVCFWFDGDSLCYSLPTNRWDAPSLNADLVVALSVPQTKGDPS